MKGSAKVYCWKFIIVAVLLSAPATRAEDIDVLEGSDATLRCRFSSLALSDSETTVYWMRQRLGDGDKENVAIGGKIFDPNYRVEFFPEQGRYDLTIRKAMYGRDNGRFECHVRRNGNSHVLHTTEVNLTVLLRPRAPTVTPDAPTAIEGQHINLTCSSHGGSPDPEITWYRTTSPNPLKSILRPGGGKDFPTTSVLTLSPEKEDDGAQYKCVVWNRALRQSDALEAFVTLSVNYYPRITIGPEDPLKVELNQPTRMVCSVEAKPPVPNIRWVYKGSTVSLNRTLYVEKVTINNAGNYECRADNGLGRPVSEKVNLDVLYGPTVTVHSSKEAEIGNSIAVMCNVTANPAPVTIEWRKIGDSSFHSSGDVLMLEKVSAVDHGDYVCRAKNIIDPSAGDQVTREGNATIAIRIRHAPGTATILPENPIAVKDENTSLYCKADPPGWPAPNYHWWREDPSKDANMGSSYVISRASVKDEGVYHCKPKNSLGEGTTAEATVHVYEAPRILEGLEESEILRNGKQNVRLRCRAEGKPEPSVSWYKDGHLIRPEDGLYEIEEEPLLIESTIVTVLVFRGPQRINENQLMPQDRGVFMCLFKNNVREVSSKQLLRIEHAPITIHKQNKVAYNLDDVAELECRMQAYPYPNFQWSKGPNFINPNNTSHYSMANTDLGNDIYASILQIKGVKESNYGEYICKGRNVMGDHRTIIKLQKKGPPDAPSNIRIKSVETDSFQVLFDPGFDGGDIDTQYLVKVNSLEGSKVVDCMKQNPCPVEKLRQHATYAVQVKAYNRYGNSSYTEPVKETTRMDVGGIPAPQKVVIVPSSSLISFEVEGTPVGLEGHVEVWYKDSSDWMSLPVVTLIGNIGDIILDGGEIPHAARVKLCTVGGEKFCGPYVDATEVDYLPRYMKGGNPVQYIVVVIVICLVVVGIIVLITAYCCYRKQKERKLKKAVDMEVSHRGVGTQQPPPPYCTVGLDNKGMDGSLKLRLNDHNMMGDYGTHLYNNGYNIQVQPPLNGINYGDNSYSNSNNGGSVNSQDSLWHGKGHGDQQSHAQDIRANYQYDPMIHGGYGIPGHDDYALYPPHHQNPTQDTIDYSVSQGGNGYIANGDPYVAVNKQRKRMDAFDGTYDVSGVPDPYLQPRHDPNAQGVPELTPDIKPQISFDESLESGYSTPNSRNRKVIREIIV